MQAKRKTIGRTLSATPLFSLSTEQSRHSQRFILKSGKSTVFYLEHIAADDIEEKTFVRFSINGRDQNALTAESLADITRTIKVQQFFPAIGYRNAGRIEILDGSRRRAAAILCHVGLSVLVSDSPISSEDARQLAVDIQTSKEHNLREIGLRLLQLRSQGLSQKEIASKEKMSESKVTRAIQAALVPEYLISLFPIQSELVYSDYKTLLSMETLIQTKGLSNEDIVHEVNDKMTDILDKSSVASDEWKKTILAILKTTIEKLSPKSVLPKISTTALWHFDDKNTYARKRLKERGFSYEFNRIPKHLQEELDEVIRKTIEVYYGSSDEVKK